MKLSNIYRHPISTLVSIGMLVYTFYLVQVGRETLTTALPLISFALYGLGKRDPNNQDQPPFDAGSMPQMLVLLFLLALPLGSCRTLKKTSSHKEVSRDSTAVTVRDRAIEAKVEGAAMDMQALIKCDSLGRVAFDAGFHAGLADWLTMQGNRVEISTSQNLVVKNRNGSYAALHLDSSGRLQIRSGCDSLTRIVHAQDSTIKLLRFRSYITSEKVKEVSPWWVPYVLVGQALFFLLCWVVKRVYFS